MLVRFQNSGQDAWHRPCADAMGNGVEDGRGASDSRDRLLLYHAWLGEL